MTALDDRPTTPPAPPPPPPTERTVQDLCESAVELARRSPAPLLRLTVRDGDRHVDLEFAAAAVPSVLSVTATPVAVPVGEPVAAAPTGSVVRAPLVGTFYAAPTPGADPFVAVGDEVQAGRTVGIVEAMKLMNPVVSDVSGTVVEVRAADGDAVEYDQPLMVVREF